MDNLWAGSIESLSKAKNFLKNFQKYIDRHLLIVNQETMTILLNSQAMKLNFNSKK
jgi:hypothetical protein